MNEDYMVENNIARNRFEVALGDEFAFIDYRYYHKDLAFMHTLVPENMQGKGIASIMARAALDFARKERRKILLFCPFMARFVKEHPEYHDLVDKAYHSNFEAGT